MRLTVPISSALPQRPQLESSFIHFSIIGLREIGALDGQRCNQSKTEQCAFHWTIAATTICSVFPVESPTTFGSPGFQFARDPS